MTAPGHTLLIGDNRATMATLPPKVVQCAITSPPYWGLRDYGIPPSRWTDGTTYVLGLEPTPELFIAHVVEVFQEVRRVLRDDGALFVNFGDSYAGSGRGGYPGDAGTLGGSTVGQDNSRFAKRASKQSYPGLKVGELINMPHRIAAALSANGWYWRSTIIWAKRSPMPESLAGWRWMRCRVKVKGTGWTKETHPNANPDAFGRTPTYGSNDGKTANPNAAKWEPCPGCKKCQDNDGLVLRRGKWRPTTGHEYVFMFSKSEKYFCDGDAVKELCTGNAHSRGHGVNLKAKANGQVPRVKQNESFSGSVVEVRKTRNPRSVWTLSSEPYKGAHFATFPTLLPKRCIEAGTSAAGCCPACGSCYAPVVETERVATRPGVNTKCNDYNGAFHPDSPYRDHSEIGNRDPQRHIAITEVAGYRPTCKCNSGAPVPCTVLDPFAGSGTTLQVAKALGRKGIGCEISESYAELAEKRINTTPKWAKPEKPKRKRKSPRQKEMFAEACPPGQ